MGPINRESTPLPSFPELGQISRLGVFFVKGLCFFSTFTRRRVLLVNYVFIVPASHNAARIYRFCSGRTNFRGKL